MIRKDLFPVYECSGTPYEIGYAHGSQAKKQITVSINNYRAMFKDYSDIDWESARNYAKTFIPAITAFDPEIMEEIRGVAAGSGYDLEDILALNVRSEIVLQGDQINKECSDGCSSFAFTPYKTVTGETFIGQNWDWKLTEREGLVILKIKQQKKPDITMITEAGIIGKIGFNSAGIGVCLNALASDKKADGELIPLHVAMRGALNSQTLSDAIREVGRVNLACCVNFTMASAEGQAICIEIGAGDIDVIYADDGYCVHTNHFYGPRMVNTRDTGRIGLPDSYLRLGRFRDMIKHGNDKIGIKDIKTMLCDHVGYPDAICRHEDFSEPEEKRLVTLFSVIMNLDREEMYFAPGNPCECGYHIVK